MEHSMSVDITKTTKKPKPVNSVIRAVEILKKLANEQNRITDIAFHLKLSKSTTHRLLNTMEQSGMVSRDPINNRYYLGPLFLSLSSNPLITHHNLTLCAYEEMEYLRSFSDETVAIHIPTGKQSIFLEELPSFQEVKFTAGKGTVAPLYAAAEGRVLLSQLNQDQIDTFLSNITLKSITQKSITDKRLLKQEIKKVKKEGYAVSFGERVPGGGCISVPVFGYVCSVALSAIGPDTRIKGKMKFLPAEMKKVSTRITSKLKFQLQNRRI